MIFLQTLVSEVGNVSDVFVRTGDNKNKNPLSIIFDKIGDLKIEKEEEEDLEDVDDGRELLQSVAETLLGLVGHFEMGNNSIARSASLNRKRLGWWVLK